MHRGHWVFPDWSPSRVLTQPGVPRPVPWTGTNRTNLGRHTRGQGLAVWTLAKEAETEGSNPSPRELEPNKHTRTRRQETKQKNRTRPKRPTRRGALSPQGAATIIYRPNKGQLARKRASQATAPLFTDPTRVGLPVGKPGSCPGKEHTRRRERLSVPPLKQG